MMNLADFLLETGWDIQSAGEGFSGTTYARNGVQEWTRKLTGFVTDDEPVDITINENRYGVEFDDSYSVDTKNEGYKKYLSGLFNLWQLRNTAKAFLSKDASFGELKKVVRTS